MANIVYFSATRCAALDVLTRDGGGTIADMCNAAGWSVGAARGTIAVYRAAGIHVPMVRDADGTERYRAVIPAGTVIANTGRGQWKRGARPVVASDAAPVPGNPGDIATRRMIDALTAFANPVPVADPVADPVPADVVAVADPVADPVPADVVADPVPVADVVADAAVNVTRGKRGRRAVA